MSSLTELNAATRAFKADQLASQSFPDPDLQKAFDANKAAIAKARDPLAILQDEIVATAIRIRDNRRFGIEPAVRSYTAALFSLLRVRRQMREMGL